MTSVQGTKAAHAVLDMVHMSRIAYGSNRKLTYPVMHFIACLKYKKSGEAHAGGGGPDTEIAPIRMSSFPHPTFADKPPRWCRSWGPLGVPKIVRCHHAQLQYYCVRWGLRR